MCLVTFDHTEKQKSPLKHHSSQIFVWRICVYFALFQPSSESWQRNIGIDICNVIFSWNPATFWWTQISVSFVDRTSPHCFPEETHLQTARIIGFASCIASGTYSSMTLDLGLFIFNHVTQIKTRSNLMQHNFNACMSSCCLPPQSLMFEKLPGPNRKGSFSQTPFFRAEPLNFGGVCDFFLPTFAVCGFLIDSFGWYCLTTG